MVKALGIDFGLKRTGFAMTDDAGIIASPLETIDSRNLPDYLNKIINREKIIFINLLNQATFLRSVQNYLLHLIL